MLTTFEKFLQDPDAGDMFVLGRAGTGKTTDLKTTVQWCIDNKTNYVVCAFTHKACDILRDKLPAGAKVQTLHKYLKKRPTVNTEATKLAHVEGNAVAGDAEAVSVVFIDEFGMVGEQDLMDVRALQDEDDNGRITLKCVWIGDHKYQLPPVGDQFTLFPYGKYQLQLTKIYRQGADNPLLKTLDQLVSFIDGADPEPLIESSHFVRNQDIIQAKLNGPEDSILLAFTNERVEALNRDIQGYAWPQDDDSVFSPSTKQRYRFVCTVDQVQYIDLPYGKGGQLFFDSKWRTLEHLLEMPEIHYGMFEREPDSSGSPETSIHAFVFGHHQYNLYKNALKKTAVQANKLCTKEEARANPGSAKARQRAKAWRDFLTFNECVVCMDFAHAVTVHKSQGSTYNEVYLDIKDIERAREFNYNLYLRLLYTGISRASNRVITN